MTVRFVLTSILLLALPGQALTAQVITPSNGPDLVVTSITGVQSYGSSGGIASFSLGSVICNYGNQAVAWNGATAFHPVIAQNLYRLTTGGRFEQIGLSWVSNAQSPQNASGCPVFTCSGSQPNLLGPGCSDYRSAVTNGDQIGLTARSEVNPATGLLTYPPVLVAPTGTLLGGRIQVKHLDLDPTFNPGARYFAEINVVSEDASAGHTANNASFVEVLVNPQTIGGTPSFSLQTTGPTQVFWEGIVAWWWVDPTVVVEHVDVPGDGRFSVGRKAVDLGNGTFRYEYAVHNLSSDRAGGAVSVELAPGAVVQNVGFHDVDYHSGEPWSGTDWTWTQTANGIRWATETMSTNPNANALRWGTAYSFWFESSSSPGPLTIELWKPGAPATVVSTQVSMCPPAPVSQNVYDYVVTPNAPYDYVGPATLIPVAQFPGALAVGNPATVPIMFDFPFWGTVLNDIQISPHGYLTLPTSSGTQGTNQALPTAPSIGVMSEPNGVIAGFWDDLDTGLGGAVRYAVLGTAPIRKFVVEYYGVPHTANPAQTESFQIALYETTGKITTSFASTATGGSGATIGLESPDGNYGRMYAFNTPGSVVPATTVQFDRLPLGTTNAAINVTGTWATGTPMNVQVLGTPNAPFILVGDLDRGPTNLGPQWPPLDIGFSAAFMTIVDGLGIFTAPNPLGALDSCGSWQVSFPSPLPSGFNYTIQAVVIPALSPVFTMHLSNSYRILVP